MKGFGFFYLLLFLYEVGGVAYLIWLEKEVTMNVTWHVLKLLDMI